MKTKKPQVETNTVGALAMFLYFLATVQVVICYMRNVPAYMALPHFESGGASRPFQGRLLMMFPLRWAHGSSFWIALAAQAQRHAPWLLPHGTPETFLQVAINMVSVGITGAVAVQLYQASSQEKLLSAWIYPIVLVMCVGTYMLHASQNFRFPYDLPSMMFFSVGLYLIYFRGHPALFAALFLIATINRETTLVLLLFYALGHVVDGGRVNLSRLRDLRVWGVIVPLGTAWLAWRLWVHWVFRLNPSESVPRFLFNVILVLIPLAWPQLLGAGCYLFPVIFLFRRSISDPVLRIWLWTLPAWLGLMFFYGLLIETRIFGELIGYLACLIALIAEQAVLAALRKQGWSRGRDLPAVSGEFEGITLAS